MLYLSVARGTLTVPGTSGKTTWWETNRSYQRPPDVARGGDAGRRRLREAPHAVDHRRLQRGRAAELQAQVAREPGRGHHVHLLADPDACRATPADPPRAGRAVAACARSSMRRSRGLSVEAVAARFGRHVDDDGRRLRPCRAPWTARAGPSGQWPGRTARRRISSTVVRVGPGREADLGALAALDDLEPVERRAASPASAPASGSPPGACR